MLTEQGIRRYIKSDIDIIFLEESPSTNLEAKSIAATAREGTVIFARRQFSGRGRIGRSFESPEGGIYMTMLVRPTGSLYPDSQPPVSIDEMAAAMADQLYKALTNPSDPSIYREYRASSMLTGKRVVLMREGEPEATAIDVTPEGHLVVRFDDGCTEELYSGEVSVRAAEYPHTV